MVENDNSDITLDMGEFQQNLHMIKNDIYRKTPKSTSKFNRFQTEEQSRYQTEVHTSDSTMQQDGYDVIKNQLPQSTDQRNRRWHYYKTN